MNLPRHVVAPSHHYLRSIDPMILGKSRSGIARSDKAFLEHFQYQVKTIPTNKQPLESAAHESSKTENIENYFLIPANILMATQNSFQESYS